MRLHGHYPTTAVELVVCVDSRIISLNMPFQHESRIFKTFTNKILRQISEATKDELRVRLRIHYTV